MCYLTKLSTTEIICVVDGWKSAEHWYWQGENISAGSALQCHAVHNKFDVDSPGIEPRPPRWGAGDWQLEPWPSRWCVSLPLCSGWLNVLLCAYWYWRVPEENHHGRRSPDRLSSNQTIDPSGRLASLCAADIFSCQILQASLLSVNFCMRRSAAELKCLPAPSLCWSHLLKLTCFSHLAYSRSIKLTAYFITWTIPLESFTIQRHKTRNFSHNLFVYQWAFIGATLLTYLLKKVKQSRNRPGVAQRVPGGLVSQIFMTFGTWRWWGQPHAPAAFTPRNVPGTHFH